MKRVSRRVAGEQMKAFICELREVILVRRSLSYKIIYTLLEVSNRTTWSASQPYISSRPSLQVYSHTTSNFSSLIAVSRHTKFSLQIRFQPKVLEQTCPVTNPLPLDISGRCVEAGQKRFKFSVQLCSSV